VLDAGCGDGRVVALLAGVFQLPAHGIEYDPALCQRARQNLERLSARLPGLSSRTILCGDFTDDHVYRQGGLPFHRFGTVFNYANNHSQIAAKIAFESPPGTRFLLYYPSRHVEPLPGLEWTHSIPCAPDKPNTTHVHVYVKPV